MLTLPAGHRSKSWAPSDWVVRLDAQARGWFFRRFSVSQLPSLTISSFVTLFVQNIKGPQAMPSFNPDQRPIDSHLVSSGVLIGGLCHMKIELFVIRCI